MRLSEAIRLGAMLRPQTTGAIYKHGKSCAWGAAWEAMGGDIEHWSHTMNMSSHSICMRFWPELNKEVIDPIGGDLRKLYFVIEYLNDNPNCWTRERIADWVTTIESPTEVPSDTIQTPTHNPVGEYTPCHTGIECTTTR